MEVAALFVRRSLLLAALLLLPAGCGKKSLSQAEMDQGRASVEDGLRAWQNGEKPEALQKREPAIRFSDEDWSRGLRLAEWEITSTNGSAGDLTPRCEVVLNLVDGKGNKTRRRVVYQVEKKNGIVVVRDPYF